MRELYFNVRNLVDAGLLVSHNQHNTTLQGLAKPFLRKIYTDEPSFFELLSGKIEDVSEVPEGSKAAEIIAVQAEHYELEPHQMNTELIRNPYIATSRFKNRVQILKRGE